MALAEIASLVPVISISIGFLDIDIDLTRHTSTGNPTTSTTSTSTQTIIPTSNVPTNTAASGGFVTSTTSPNTPTPGDRSTFADSPAPTVSVTEHTSLATFSPGASPTVSPTVIATSISGVVRLAPQGTSAEVVGDATLPTTTLSGGIPVAAAEGFPTVAVTLDNESTIRPITGYPGTGLTSIAGSSSTTGVGGISSSRPGNHHGAKRLSPGIIAAIIISLFFILFGFIFCLCRRRRTRRDQDTIAWQTRSYGTNTSRRDMRSTLALPFHARSRSTQEETSILSPTSPTSPTFLITAMAEASQSMSSVLSDVSRNRHHDARLSTSSDGSATYSRRSFEDTWRTPVRPIDSAESSAFLKPQLVDHDSSISRPTIQSLKIPKNFDNLGSALSKSPSQIDQLQPPNKIPFSAFRLTTVPVPPIPPLPSSPPPIPPPSPRVLKTPPGGLINPFDPPSSPTRPLSNVEVVDPFQDPIQMD